MPTPEEAFSAAFAPLETRLDQTITKSNETLVKLLKDNESDILDFNRQQMNDGERAGGDTGDDIVATGENTQATEEIKRAGAGSAAGFPRLNSDGLFTLNDTGELYNSLEIKTAEESFSIESKGDEVQKIADSFIGDPASVLGLQTDSIDATRDLIREDYIDTMQDFLLNG